jgi:transposase InsO family protein
MRRMGIEALYRRPRTTKPEPGHKIYPYLLRGVEITQPNQVWAMDITYIPMERLTRQTLHLSMRKLCSDNRGHLRLARLILRALPKIDCARP